MQSFASHFHVYKTPPSSSRMNLLLSSNNLELRSSNLKQRSQSPLQSSSYYRSFSNANIHLSTNQRLPLPPSPHAPIHSLYKGPRLLVSAPTPPYTNSTKHLKMCTYSKVVHSCWHNMTTGVWTTTVDGVTYGWERVGDKCEKRANNQACEATYDHSDANAIKRPSKCHACRLKEDVKKTRSGREHGESSKLK